MPEKKRAPKKTDADYKAMAKSLKPYVNFPIDLRKNLSKSDKAKITRYYKALNALTARPYFPKRFNSKKRLALAKQFSHTDKTTNLPGFKVAFIPVETMDQKPVIRFTDKGMQIKGYYVTTNFLPFDRKKLIKNPLAHVAETIALDPQANAFTVRCGNYEIIATKPRFEIARYVASLVNDPKYATAGSEHYAGDWLVGLNSHNFKNQDSEDAYLRRKSKARNKHYLERKAEQARKKRAKTKESERAELAAEKAAQEKKNKQLELALKENAKLKARLAKIELKTKK